MREFTKTFEKVPASKRRHGGKVYKYGYVWILLPPECIGKTALLKVYVFEEGERPPAQPAQPVTPQPQLAAPRPQPQVRPQPAQLQVRPQPMPQPRPAQPRPQPPQPPLPPLQPPSLSPELASLLKSLRPQPEQTQPLRDLLPFEEFTLEPEEKGEEERKRRLFGLRWP